MKTKRENDHIRHATSDGVFCKVATDIAMAEWQRDNAIPKAFSGERPPDVNYKQVLISLIVGLTGLSEIEVRQRIVTETSRERAKVDRMAATMRKDFSA